MMDEHMLPWAPLSPRNLIMQTKGYLIQWDFIIWNQMKKTNKWKMSNTCQASADPKEGNTHANAN